MTHKCRTWVVSIVAMSLAAFVVATAQAEMIVDGSIFDDEFNGSELDQWQFTWQSGDGSATVADGVVTIHTSHHWSVKHAARISTINPLDFSSAPNDWWVETKFKMVGYLDDANEETRPGIRPVSWSILCGDYDGNFLVRGFDLRALEHTNESHYETVYDLGWWGSNNNNDDVADERYLQSEVIYENLNKDQFYTINLHRKPDGTVDIYLDGVLIDTKPLIRDTNPTYLLFGDTAGLDVGGTQVVDYVRVGALVPEPSTLALLTAGLVGLLAYAWRKRK